MVPERKAILYIACSLDGYIARPNDDLSFLSIVQKEGEDYGYSDFIKTIDTVILGRKTYDWVKITYVITRTPKPAIGKTIFYTGDLKGLVLHLKKESGKNIFVDGGAEIVDALLKENLIDEIILSIIPIFVGSGTRLFKDERPEQKLKLLSSKSFDTGLVQLHYTRPHH